MNRCKPRRKAVRTISAMPVAKNRLPHRDDASIGRKLLTVGTSLPWTMQWHDDRKNGECHESEKTRWHATIALFNCYLNGKEMIQPASISSTQVTFLIRITMREREKASSSRYLGATNDSPSLFFSFLTRFPIYALMWPTSGTGKNEMNERLLRSISSRT